MRLQFLALIAGTIALAGAAVCAAEPVERSGNTFHVAVCARAIPVRTARCHAHIVTDQSGNPRVNAASNATPSGYGPAQLQSAYNVPQSVNPASVPSGPVIAIVDAYGFSNAEADLATYRSKFGLPACTTANGCFRKINETGGTNYPSNNTGWDQEQALDIEMVSAICPNCRILLVEASSASYSDLGIAVNEAAAYPFPDGSRAHAISNSYGGGESGSTGYAGFYNHPGVAVTVSTGDSAYSAGPQFPATTPYVTAVGGTSLYNTPSGGRSWTETVWSGAGSGCSAVYAKPSWQHDPLCTMRMEADTSAVADPNTGVAVYGPVFGRFQGWEVFGGTSVASPLTAAIYGLNGGAVSLPATGNPPYPPYPYAYAGSTWPYGTNPHLNVITSGNNGSCNGIYFCTASPSWNYNGPAGLGTPSGDLAF